ncbi:hypothetical protein [Pseudarthrobacter sp. MM222]|uniref:hypothetical protein n=1 Tax=Pseudarthrobacter sp. MM222 TaxID=3018929 RepID=UPI00221F2029|nr:hypothetical protein [Pseudarthrobacter sp. MM222]CAI3799295.1 hypothetical protein NKCBBBOE_02290 [Pseudarthrobacter sp. MM222]
MEVTQETPAGIRIGEVGIHGLHLMKDGRTTRVVVTEKKLGPAAKPTLADLGKALTEVFGTDFGVRNPTSSPPTARCAPSPFCMMVDARYDGGWKLPVIGSSALLRPC